MKRGALIIFEGVDRCGKTTQCSKLVETLSGKGIKVEMIRFPMRDTEIGKILDSYLKNTQDLSDQAVHLLFSANRWELNNKIRQKLQEGVTLVVDRYAYSGACYSASKGLDFEWCKSPDKGLPQPDLVLFLDLEIEKSRKRGAFGTERYEKDEMQKKVRKLFLETAKTDSCWKVIDADQTIEKLSEVILQEALTALETATTSDIGELYSKEKFSVTN